MGKIDDGGGKEQDAERHGRGGAHPSPRQGRADGLRDRAQRRRSATADEERKRDEREGRKVAGMHAVASRQRQEDGAAPRLPHHDARGRAERGHDARGDEKPPPTGRRWSGRGRRADWRWNSYD